MARSSNLISAEELQSRIGEPDIAILDCRFDLGDPGAGRRLYREAHIPGAAFADLDLDLSAEVGPQTGRHPLPTAERLAGTLGRLGISNASRVIVYDADSGALGARAWWLLRWLGHDRVQLLDGGIARWAALSFELAAGDEAVQARRFSAAPRDGRVLTTTELAANIEGIPEMRLLDARDGARFRGEVEPIDPVAGHIPGTRNLPFGMSLRDDGTWKSAAELETLWTEVLGQDRKTSWSVMCGSGVTACHLAISAIEAGFSEPRLYVGSWSEWIRDPGRPIARGER